MRYQVYTWYTWSKKFYIYLILCRYICSVYSKYTFSVYILHIPIHWDIFLDIYLVFSKKIFFVYISQIILAQTFAQVFKFFFFWKLTTKKLRLAINFFVQFLFSFYKSFISNDVHTIGDLQNLYYRCILCESYRMRVWWREILSLSLFPANTLNWKEQQLFNLLIIISCNKKRKQCSWYMQTSRRRKQETDFSIS